ncbi:MAG: hypothetical protein HQL24_05185 [Candidatus Omnitrophica bacterium]|nr:hypothetical protein [Candidatus Omnitrophota bacterium]
MRERKDYKNTLRYTGLGLIGIFSLFYVLFPRVFAEMHLSFSFLNFPVFVGEILLFLCLPLFFLSIDFKQLTNRQWWLVIGYAVFVLSKAFYGYHHWGPLAFRHAALFYYPIFILFGVVFYRKELFTEEIRKCIIFLFCALFLARFFDFSWVLTMAALTGILIKSLPNKRERYFFLGLLLLTLPYHAFIAEARTYVFGFFIGFCFLIIAMTIISPFRCPYKILLFVSIFSLFLFIMIRYSFVNAFNSIFQIKRIAAVFKEYQTEIEKRKPAFVPKKLENVALYNPENDLIEDFTQLEKSKKSISSSNIKASEALSVKALEEKKASVQEKSVAGPEIVSITNTVVNPESENLTLKQLGTSSPAKVLDVSVVQSSPTPAATLTNSTGINTASEKPILNQIATSSPVMSQEEPAVKAVEIVEESVFQKSVIKLETLRIKDSNSPLVNSGKNFWPNIMKKSDGPPQSFVGRNVEGAHINTVFRLFIWRDMIAELTGQKKFFGFDFGKPFRSISLEILDWGEGEWQRDGWIASHNSFLSIIYRSGIIGFCFILSLLGLLWFMIRGFIALKSVTGILLCGILISWFVAANFLLIFELPYTAIPVWTLFGMTLGYLKEQRKPA